MKPTFIALLALCLCVAGCGKKEEKQLPVMSPASREVQALDLAEAKAAKGAARAKARMEAWIRGAAKKPTGELTKADYEKVEAVDLTGYQLTKVPKDLEKLTQLKGLYLSFNKLTDVKGLDKLTQLERLNLGHNQLTSVKELE